jgi:hypothetical protein
MILMALRRIVRGFLYFLLGVIGLQALILGGVYLAMRQPPRTFGRIMKRVPMQLMLAVPFRPLWFAARAGTLDLGEEAPDFELATVDKRSRVRLSGLRGRPVALVFGSYT